jgi:hypothetical protein
MQPRSTPFPPPCGPFPLDLKPRTDKARSQVRPGSAPDGRPGSKTGDRDERVLVCRDCAQPVTRPEARTVIEGKHIHVFCNPTGVVYEVACFAFASGLTPEGGIYAEFSWFPGHSWQIVNCSRCGAHLGWRFTSRSGSGFHGLLPAMLREQGPDL